LSVVVQLPSELGVTSPKRFALGGMAELFRGEKHYPQGGRARLVVKHMLPQHLEVAELVSRFRDEARLGLMLRHSNIARVLEYWEIDGHHYMIMEEVDGHNLSSVIYHCRQKGFEIPQEVAAYFIFGIASALAYMADARGEDGENLDLVHRDISPSNILVSREGVVRLIDFGVAKASQRETQTRAGYFVGKFAYMSPEQIRGDHVDIRSDIFALGAVAYELLAGERPFQGGSEYETFNLVLSQEPVPLVEAREGLHPLLARIVYKCLSKDAEDRYSHPIELVEQLNVYFHGAVERPPPLLSTQFLGMLGLTPSEDPLEIEIETHSTSRRSDPAAAQLGPETATTPSRLVEEVEDTVAAPDAPSSPTLVGPKEATTMRRRSPRLLLLLGWTLPLAAAVLLLAGLVALGVWALSTFSIPGRGAPTAGSEGLLEAIIEDAAEEEAADAADEASSAQAEDLAAEDPVEEAVEQPVAARPGTLQIRAIPWCEVWIDTRPYGRTPIDAELAAGTYRVQANKPELGWIHDQTVTIRAGQTVPLQFSPAVPPSP
jgi:eukaryotic-like serine/threonine-protein kinase